MAPSNYNDAMNDAMTSPWQPYREPLRTTLLRTVIIALVVGAVLARYAGGMARWPIATLLVLWFSFGGHWIELWFLNWLRPRIPAARATQVAARLAVWFIGGTALALAMSLTALSQSGPRPVRWSAWGPTWWLGGMAFISIELIAHLALQLRGRASFYNGRG